VFPLLIKTVFNSGLTQSFLVVGVGVGVTKQGFCVDVGVGVGVSLITSQGYFERQNLQFS
jgi:hypothetical protein